MKKYKEFTRKEIIFYWHQCQDELQKLNVKFNKKCCDDYRRGYKDALYNMEKLAQE